MEKRKAGEDFIDLRQRGLQRGPGTDLPGPLHPEQERDKISLSGPVPDRGRRADNNAVINADLWPGLLPGSGQDLVPQWGQNLDSGGISTWHEEHAFDALCDSMRSFDSDSISLS